MATSRRKTTQEEKQKIVNWCFNHDKNYKLAAEKFNCSYAQKSTTGLKSLLIKVQMASLTDVADIRLKQNN